MKRYTSYADKQEMIGLHEQGYSYRQIASKTGWKFETVRKICREYQRHGQRIQQARLGRPPTGPLSTFSCLVCLACLKIKIEHPTWGPDVVQAELGKRPWAPTEDLPSSSQIGAYFHQFGDRLIHPRAHKQLPKVGNEAKAFNYIHGCWQIDVKERKELPEIGQVDILEVTDRFSGLKLGVFLFPAYVNGKRRKISGTQYRDCLRKVFLRWGIPACIQTDRERVLVAEGDYPFPMPFSLWLAGLGIHHRVIQRAPQNGSVERLHRTSDNRLAGYGPFQHLAEWQEMYAYEYWRMNAILPSRNRHCRRLPPLMVFAADQHSSRWYRREDELSLFSLQAVFDYLRNGKWFRRSSQKGQFSFAGQKFSVGTAHKRCHLMITHWLEHEFAVVCPPDKEILLILQVNGLTIEALTSSPDTEEV